MLVQAEAIGKIIQRHPVEVEVSEAATEGEIKEALERKARALFNEDLCDLEGSDFEVTLDTTLDVNGEEASIIDFTAHGRITFRGKTPEDWVGEAKSIIENLGCDDPQVKDLDIHRVDIYS